jgi:hypothetical protein
MIPGYIYYYSPSAELVERAFNTYHLVGWWSWVHRKWFDYRADRVRAVLRGPLRIPDTAVVIMRVKL